jgi:predicted permease
MPVLMVDTLLRVFPVLLGFVGGFLLRRFRVAEHRDGDFLLRLAFSVCLPALIFTSLSTVQITAALAVYPLSSVLFTVVGFALALLMSRRTRWPSTRTAVMITVAGSPTAGSSCRSSRPSTGPRASSGKPRSMR